MAGHKNVGMSLDASDVMAKLHRTGEKVLAGSLEEMRKQAALVFKLAKLNVPVEDFHVEDSIVMSESRTGLNRRTEISIGVSEALLNTLSGTQFNYAIWLHEAQYNLGPLSEVKNEISQAEDYRSRVGNKYLERAINTVRTSAPKAVTRKVKEAIQ